MSRHTALTGAAMKLNKLKTEGGVSEDVEKLRRLCAIGEDEE